MPSSTFRDQIRAQLLWRKLIGQKVQPDTHVTEEEVQMVRRRAMTPTPENQQLQISVLGLAVDKPSREAEVHALAEKLITQVRGGANFEELARQFGNGGRTDKFWVTPAELDPVIGHALLHAAPGTITAPLRSNNGFTIIKVYDTRAPGKAKDEAVRLKEILLKVKPDANMSEADMLLSIGDEVSKHPGSCEDKTVAGISNPQDFDISTKIIEQRVSELPSALRVISQNLNIGEISTPIASYEGIRLYMLCSRQETDAKAPAADQIRGGLMEEKLQLGAQKYMRNLRREAFVEIKG